MSLSFLKLCAHGQNDCRAKQASRLSTKFPLPQNIQPILGEREREVSFKTNHPEFPISTLKHRYQRLLIYDLTRGLLKAMSLWAPAATFDLRRLAAVT